MDNNRLTGLFQQIKSIRNVAADIDISQQSGLPQDVIDAIENPEADHSKITLPQLSNYLFPLGYTLDFKTAGLGKLSESSPVVTIVLKVVVRQLSDTVVSLNTAPAPL